MVCACMCVCSCATFGVRSWGFFFLVFFCVFQILCWILYSELGHFQAGCVVGTLRTQMGVSSKTSFCQCILRKMKDSEYWKEHQEYAILECKGGVYWWWGLHTHQRRWTPLKQWGEQFWVSEHRGEWMEVVLAENYFSHSKVDWVVGRVIWHKTLSLHIWPEVMRAWIKLVVIKPERKEADGSKKMLQERIRARDSDLAK